MKDAEFLLHWTTNSWGMKIRKTHLCFTQWDSPLWGFQPVSSLLINFFSPLCSLSLSAACTLYNEHTHTPTQPVRNHKTCCFLSCSDDNLPVTRGKRFSQPIKKLITHNVGKSLLRAFEVSDKSMKIKNNASSRQVCNRHPHWFCFPIWAIEWLSGWNCHLTVRRTWLWFTHTSACF